MLQQVSAADLANPSTPGEYCVNNVHYEVNNLHVAAWRERPETRFRTILKTRLGDKRIRLALGGPIPG